VVRLNFDCERGDLDALRRVEDNRLVLLKVESYDDVNFNWEKGAVCTRGYFPSLLVSHSPSYNVKTE
jgi:hypothetical protein